MKLKATWKELPGYPTLVKGLASGVVDGYLLAAAGMGSPWRQVEFGNFTKIDENANNNIHYDPDGSALNSWIPLPPLPHGICWTSGAACAGGLLVVGGRYKTDDMNNVPGKAIKEVWFLDFTNGKKEWDRLEDRPSAAVIANTFCVGDYIYSCFGSEWNSNYGMTYESSNGDLNIYRMNVRERSGWEIAATFPGKARWVPNVTVCGNKFHVIGGVNKIVTDNYKSTKGVPFHLNNTNGNFKIFIERYSDVWECNLDTQEWMEKENAPRTFADRGFSYKDRWIIFTGGYTCIVNDEVHFTHLKTYSMDMDFVSYSDECWAYDTVTSEWMTLDSLPYGIVSHAIAPYENKVYLLGNETMDKHRGNTYNTLFEGVLEVD